MPQETHNTLVGATHSFQPDTHQRAIVLTTCKKHKMTLLIRINQEKVMHLKRPAPSRVFSGSPSRIHRPPVAYSLAFTHVLGGS